MKTLLEEVRARLKAEKGPFKLDKELTVALDVISLRFAQDLAGWSHLKDVEKECRGAHENRRDQLDGLQVLIRSVQAEVGRVRETSDPAEVHKLIDAHVRHMDRTFARLDALEAANEMIGERLSVLQGTLDNVLRAMTTQQPAACTHVKPCSKCGVE